MNKMKLWATWILLALPFTLVAEPLADKAVNLSLDECIAIALNDNPTIKVADMEIERVDYSKKETLGQLMPNVTFTGQYSRTLAKQTMYMDTGQGVVGIKMGRDNSYSTGFSATVPIYMPQLWKSLKLSDNQVLQNLEAARASKLQLVNQVKNTYYALLLAHDSKKVLEDNHATAKLNASIYDKKYKLGTASEYDMLRANVAVSNIEPSILEAENSINQLKLQLKLLMGMDAQVNIEPSQTLDHFKGSMYECAIRRDTSLVDNTDMKSLDLKTDYLQKALDTQKASWLPTVTGNANMVWNSYSNGNPFDNFKWSGFSTVGLTVSIPIFQGGQRYYKQKQTEIQLNEMKWQRENLQRALHIQVQNQLDNINKSLKQIEANTNGVKQAEKANDIMQQSFKIGAGTFIQLRDTEDALMSARLTYYQSIYNYLVAESDLELVLGTAPIANYTTETTNKTDR